MRYLNIVFIFFFLFLVGSLDGHAEHIYRTIHAASESDYPPFCIVDKNGKADGFSVDLFKESASVMDLKVIFKVGSWSKIKKELADGKIDALPLVGRSPEREKDYDFTFPYHILHGAVFVREGTTGIHTIKDLKSKEIIVMKGDNAEEYVVREKLSTRVITTDNYEEAFKLLKSGKHDAVIAQRLMGLQLLNILKIDNIIPLNVKLTGFAQDFSFAVKNGNRALLARLNEGLSIIIANGTYDKLYQKWFTPEMQPQISFREKIKIVIYILIPLSISIFIIAIIVLRRQIKLQTNHLREEISVRKKAEKEIARQLSEKEIILKEVHHRIKNNMNTIRGLLSMQADQLEGPEAVAAFQDAVSRIESMGVLYDKLYMSEDYTVISLENYLSHLIDEIIQIFPNSGSIQIEKEISDFQLDPKRLFPIGIIINELLTNIMKYAFKDRDSGLINISIKEYDGNITLTVQDNGNGLAEGEDINEQKGFGLMLSKQLEGNFTVENSNGITSTLEFSI